jgi:hypothetical protein
MRPDFAAELAAAESALAQRTRIDQKLWRYVAAQVLPGTDLDALQEQSLTRSVDRYIASFANRRPAGRPIRRAVAFGYNTLKRVSA